MKKISIVCAVLCAAMSFTSCGTSKESAYRKAYEKAKAQEQAQMQGQTPYDNGQYVQQQQQQYVQQDPAQYQQPIQQQPIQQQPVQQVVQQQPVQQQPVQQQVVQQPVQQVQQQSQAPVVTQLEAPAQTASANVQQAKPVQQVQNGGLKAYSVVVSSSGNRAGAEGLCSKLRNAGYTNAQVVPNGSNFRVVASTYDSRAEAEKDKQALGAQYPGAWIMAK